MLKERSLSHHRWAPGRADVFVRLQRAVYDHMDMCIFTKVMRVCDVMQRCQGVPRGHAGSLARGVVCPVGLAVDL